MTLIPEMKVNCQELQRLMDEETTIRFNQMITEAPGKELKKLDTRKNKQQSIEVQLELDINREEDYHHIRDESIIQTLYQTILPLECKQKNDALWLSAVITDHLAKHQAFGDGNKRTAYLAGTMFLVRTQVFNGREEAFYPKLTKKLTKDIAKLATDEKTVEEYHKTLEKGLRKTI